MVCESCRAVVDDCWRWCPECGGQLCDAVRPASWQDYYSVEWTIDTEPEERLVELGR